MKGAGADISADARIWDDQPALQQEHGAVEGHADRRDEQHRHEHRRRVERHLHLQHQVAEAFVGAQELADDRARHGEDRRHLHARENVRQRAGQLDLDEGLPARALQALDQVEQVGLDLAQAAHRGEQDREDADRERDQHVRHDAVLEPDDDQRPERDLRNHVEAHEQRHQQRLERLRPGECEREQHAGHQCDEVAAVDLGRRDAHVAPPVVVGRGQRLGGVDGRRHHELRHVAELDEQIPDEQQREMRGHRHERSRPAAVERGHRGMIGGRYHQSRSPSHRPFRGGSMRLIRQAVLVAVVLAASGAAAPAFAQQKIEFILNWVPGGDHAPYYYAKKMGWYKDAGLDVNLEPGKGSAVAVQKVGAGANEIGLADMANALTLRGKGADTVGVFNVYANSPQGLYWLKSSGIRTVKDLTGKKIGNPAGDGARTIWPALAKANGIDPASVTWVNIDANSKLAALKSKSIDATTSFYNIHHIFQRELGDDMGFVAWKDAGVNSYGNTVIVNGDYLKKNKATIAAFVKVTQKAFAACVATPKPCVQALIDANGALQYDNEFTNWSLVMVLMRDKYAETVALGILDDARMAADYDLVKTYIGLDTPFDVKVAYTNEFLDRSIKMPK